MKGVFLDFLRLGFFIFKREVDFLKGSHDFLRGF